MDRHEERALLLEELLRERILTLDGAMGTAVQAAELGAADFGGPEFEGCNEHLVLTRPDVILDIHRGYLAAGADIIETDTFGGTPIVLAEYGLAERTRELNRVAAELACEAAAEHATPARPRFAAGSLGPSTKAISVTGGITFDGIRVAFREQAAGLLAGGVDLLILETQQDTRNVKAALLGIEDAFAEIGHRVPIVVSGTIEATGTMLAGQGIEAFYASLMHVDLVAIGLNCATGPEFMTDHLRALAAIARTRVSCVPNAGLPDSEGRYLETPESMARVLERFCDEGWINLLGGCCGTTPAHIRAFADMVASKRPRAVVDHRRTLISGIDFLELAAEDRPFLVGERTNVIGSRRFKRLVAEGKWEEASEIARRQVKGGASVIDICLADPDRDELTDMESFLSVLIRKVKAPLMIDSTDPEVIERALTYSQGKAIINSVNLEDGEERFASVVPIARRLGAAIVCGTIDEDPESGMAVTHDRKLSIARRAHDLLTRKYGVPEEDIIWDPLTFPCATGDAKYAGSAVETIEGIRLIKEAFPITKTILGISNVSFGLPEAGREVLNSVFLHHCLNAGLDLAIVNTEKLERYPSIPEEERKLAEDLIWNRGGDPIAAFASHFRDAASRVKKVDAKSLPLDERLANYIIEGSKDGLVEDLDLKLKEATPLAIINGPLMAGMDEVGRLFNSNQLIVAEVLESAEAMKAAVSHLEPLMEKSDSATRGKVILATVKGDVHDIGKNLVDIVFTNNGYTVVNLGIKVAPETLIDAVRDHRPDVVGLSGLLVKSAQQMVVTAADMKTAGIEIPILVGGAALSNKFTRTRIAPAYGSLVVYAKDAMQGLDLLNRLMNPEARRELAARLAEGDGRVAGTAGVAAGAVHSVEGRAARRRASRSRAVRADIAIPAVPDLERHVVEVKRLDEVWAYLNPQMLYGRHLGLRGDFERLRAAGDEKALALEEAVEAVKAECRGGAMKVRVAWRFFEAEGDGDDLRIYAGRGESAPISSFTFPRQAKEPGLCLSDFVLPPRDGARDHVALFVTTAGAGIRELAEAAKDRGEYVRSHALQALALETAEAAAEWLHARLRNLWGFPDPPEMTMRDRFRARYRGKRYSPGYPACPELADQRTIFALLEPGELGVTLTDGYMMDPEASVSAIAFHHPDAVYFGVGSESEAAESSLATPG